MQDNPITINTWPEGWEEACKSLDFLPEEMREGFMMAFLEFVLTM